MCPEPSTCNISSPAVLFSIIYEDLIMKNAPKPKNYTTIEPLSVFTSILVFYDSYCVLISGVFGHFLIGMTRFETW